MTKFKKIFTIATIALAMSIICSKQAHAAPCPYNGANVVAPADNCTTPPLALPFTDYVCTFTATTIGPKVMCRNVTGTCPNYLYMTTEVAYNCDCIDVTANKAPSHTYAGSTYSTTGGKLGPC